MSRSYHQRHSFTRGSKHPNPYIDKEYTRRRSRKIRPYGLLGFKGYGGECYSRRLKIEFLVDLVDKRKARREGKNQIKKELIEMEESYGNIPTK